MFQSFQDILSQLLPEITGLRHEFHQHPEIRFEERWTSDRIAGFLDQAGIPYRRGLARGTGIIATLEGRGTRTVALRADMDALEIQEETGLPYSSRIPDRMHACGHDGHMACLCGVAKALALRQDDLPGTVKFIFQPGEETAAGGRFMVAEGALEGVDGAFAFHGWPSLPVGYAAIKPGWAMAGAWDFRITVKGAGCHAADPGAGVDPVVVAAYVTTALQTLVSRELDPWECGVVSVSVIQAGNVTNIIPATAELRGTTRALKPEIHEAIANGVRRIAEETAKAFRATAQVEFGPEPYPAVFNPQAMVDLVREAAVEVLGEERFIELESPCMTAEDFAFYLREVPGAILYIGVNPEPGTSYPPLHNATFDFADGALLPAMEVMASIALRFLRTE